MLNDAVCFSQVYVVCGFTDLRSGIDKLAALIKAKTGNSPCIPDALFLFCGRKADRIKGIVWYGKVTVFFCCTNALNRENLYGRVQRVTLKA